MRVGDHWEARWQHSKRLTRYATRNAALASALSAAQDIWNGQRIPCEIRMSEDDDQWHPVATFGEPA